MLKKAFSMNIGRYWLSIARATRWSVRMASVFGQDGHAGPLHQVRDLRYPFHVPDLRPLTRPRIVAALKEQVFRAGWRGHEQGLHRLVTFLNRCRCWRGMKTKSPAPPLKMRSSYRNSSSPSRM